jgi:hypothetical protein
MNFEQIVRPLIGDDYDTRFPARSTAAPDLNAELSEAEAAFAADLARLYNATSNLASVEKIQHSLTGALKTIRLDAEARKKSELALVARGGRTKYRFRAAAPDGTELVFPKNGTIYLGNRHAVLWRLLPCDPVGIRRYYEENYQSSIENAQKTGDKALEEYFLEARERLIARDILRNKDHSREWSVWTSGDLRWVEREKARREHDGKTRAIYHYEYVTVEGEPFPLFPA